MPRRRQEEVLFFGVQRIDKVLDEVPFFFRI